MLIFASTALALPLFVERFDSPLSADWKVGLASGKGGAQSSVAVEDGALVLRAGPKTKRFLAASRTYETRGMDWLRVEARVRTEGVNAVAEPCGVFVQFEGKERVARGQCGSAEWRTIVRTFAVPAGAREVEVGFQLPVAGTAWIDEVIVGPVETEWRTVVRGPIEYHWLASDALSEDQLVANEETIEKVSAFLGATPKERLVVHRYLDLAAIEEYTGSREEIQVAGAAIHSIYKTDPRPYVIVLARPWGAPPPFLVEGLALSFTGEYDGRELKQASRSLAARGEAPTLHALLDPATYAALPPGARAPVAGAFVQWVVATKGAEGLKALYGALKADAPVAANEAAFRAALGMSPADADVAIRAWW